MVVLDDAVDGWISHLGKRWEEKKTRERKEETKEIEKHRVRNNEGKSDSRGIRRKREKTKGREKWR